MCTQTELERHIPIATVSKRGNWWKKDLTQGSWGGRGPYASMAVMGQIEGEGTIYLGLRRLVAGLYGPRRLFLYLMPYPSPESLSERITEPLEVDIAVGEEKILRLPDSWVSEINKAWTIIRFGGPQSDYIVLCGETFGFMTPGSTYSSITEKE